VGVLAPSSSMIDLLHPFRDLYVPAGAKGQGGIAGAVTAA
jgi:hypothetical protein